MLSGCGGGGGGGTSAAPITPAPAKPVFTSSALFSADENQTAIGTVTATDSDSTTIIFSVSGSEIAITSGGGVLTFVSVPDYETKNSYTATVTASDGTNTTTQNITISITNIGEFVCKQPTYTTKPTPVSSDTNHRYYEYFWQSSPEICVNLYHTSLLDDSWETRTVQILEWAKTNLGLLVPMNAFVMDQTNGSKAELDQINADVCRIWSPLEKHSQSECLSNQDAWGNRSAAAGVGFKHLPNGGDLFWPQNVWVDHSDIGVPIRILLHEFYHVYQNSMKFYFEATNRFGIPVRWEEQEMTYLHHNEFVTVFPNWIEEGGADFAGFVMATKYDNSIDAKKQFIEHLDEARNVIAVAANNGDTVSLKDYEYQGELYESSSNPNNGVARQKAYQYTGGALALAYLWSLDDANFKKIIVDYYEIYAEQDNGDIGNGWKNGFETLFGMTLAKFYTDFDAFMRGDRVSQIAILKTNAEMQGASWQ